VLTASARARAVLALAPALLAGCITTRSTVVRETRRFDEPEEDEVYELFRAAYFAWAERQLEDAKAKLAALYGGR